MEILLVILNAVILALMLVVLGQLNSIKKTMGEKGAFAPVEDDKKQPLPTKQDGGTDPPAPPPIPDPPKPT